MYGSWAKRRSSLIADRHAFSRDAARLRRPGARPAGGKEIEQRVDLLDRQALIGHSLAFELVEQARGRAIARVDHALRRPDPRPQPGPRASIGDAFQIRSDAIAATERMAAA